MEVINKYKLKESVEQKYSINSMSFVDAVKYGQIFTLDDYKDEIYSFFDYQTIPMYQLHLFVNIIQKYEGLLDKFIEYSGDQNIIDKYRKVSIDDRVFKNPNLFQEMYTFATDQMLYYDEDLIVRETNILLLPNKYFNILSTIYGTLDILNVSNISSMEEVVFKMANHDNLDEIAESIGMVFPPSIIDKDKYMREQLPNYVNIEKGRKAPKINGYIDDLKYFAQSLDNISDQELISYYGYHGSYNTRIEMIENIRITNNDSNFFLLDNVDNKLRNKIKIIESPYICFGNNNSYSTFNTIDLFNNFMPSNRPRYVYDDNTVDVYKKDAPITSIVFNNPDGGIFNLHQINRLLDILYTYDDVLRDQLIDKIKLGLMQNSRRTLYIENIRLRMRVDPILFELIFYAGQYMLGWEGVGTPLKNKVFRHDGVVGNLRSTYLLDKSKDIINTLDIRDLPLIDYNHGVIIFRIMTLLELIERILNREPVINAPNLLIYSSYYYSCILCNRLVIDKYDIE